MKTVTTAMLDLLRTDMFYKVELYTFTLANNAGILRYCSGDKDVIANGLTYPAGGVYGSNDAVGGPYFGDNTNIMTLHQKIGIDVDTLTFDVIAGNAKINGVDFIIACKNHVFDSAVMTVERAYMPSYGDTSAGTIIVFKGRVGAIDIGRSVATFTVNSYLELLNIDLPRNVYQTACTNTLGDSTCQVNLASYAVNLTATGGSLFTIITDTSALNQIANYYDQGRVTFTSGQLKGRIFQVVNYSLGNPGTLNILGIMPYIPAASDTFVITPGCDKSLDSLGCLKFSNQARFRGMRWIPAPSTAF